MSKSIITFNNLTKTFYIHNRKKLKDLFLERLNGSRGTKVEALRDINLKIDKGEFIGIIGPNGAGKSTLLKMISKIYIPTKGAVEVLRKTSPFLELEVGFERELKAKDNLYLYGAFLGMDRSRVNSLYSNIVNFAGLKGQMNKQFKHLSSGNKMRLGFSITVHANANVLLIDEALSVGDERFQKKALKKMLSLNKEGKTILLVSHDLDLVSKSCKKVILMNNGKVVKTGRANDIIKYYKTSLN